MTQYIPPSQQGQIAQQGQIDQRPPPQPRPRPQQSLQQNEIFNTKQTIAGYVNRNGDKISTEELLKHKKLKTRCRKYNEGNDKTKKKIDETYEAVCPYCLKHKRNWYNLMTMHIGSCVYDHRYKDLIPVAAKKDSDSSSSSSGEFETESDKSTTPDPSKSIEAQHLKRHRMLAEKNKQPPKGKRGQGKGKKTGHKRITARNPSHKTKQPMDQSSSSSDESTSESESESMYSTFDTPGANTNPTRPNTSNTSNRNRNNPNTSNRNINNPNTSNTRDTSKDFTYDRALKKLDLPRGGRWRDALGQFMLQS